MRRGDGIRPLRGTEHGIRLLRGTEHSSRDHPLGRWLICRRGWRATFFFGVLPCSYFFAASVVNESDLLVRCDGFGGLECHNSKAASAAIVPFRISEVRMRMVGAVPRGGLVRVIELSIRDGSGGGAVEDSIVGQLVIIQVSFDFCLSSQ